MSSSKILIHFKFLNPQSINLLRWYLRILSKYNIIAPNNKAIISAIFPKNYEGKIEFDKNVAEIYSYQQYISPTESFEEATLNLIPKVLDDFPGHNIGYIHLKGSSHPKFGINSIHWAISMIHNIGCFLPLFNSDQFNNYDCLGSFLTYSSMGQKLSCMLPHYPGNFWIARPQYLRCLNFKLLTPKERYSSEYFLGSSFGNMYNIESYPCRMYHYRSHYKARKLIKHISSCLSGSSNISIPQDLVEFYLGSELKISQPGFPQFIMPPSWYKNIKIK